MIKFTNRFGFLGITLLYCFHVQVSKRGSLIIKIGQNYHNALFEMYSLCATQHFNLTIFGITLLRNHK